MNKRKKLFVDDLVKYTISQDVKLTNNVLIHAIAIPSINQYELLLKF